MSHLVFLFKNIQKDKTVCLFASFFEQKDKPWHRKCKKDTTRHVTSCLFVQKYTKRQKWAIDWLQKEAKKTNRDIESAKKTKHDMSHLVFLFNQGSYLGREGSRCPKVKLTSTGIRIYIGVPISKTEGQRSQTTRSRDTDTWRLGSWTLDWERVRILSISKAVSLPASMLGQLTSTSTEERQRVTLPCCLATLLGREGRWSGMVTRKVDLVRCLSIGKAVSLPVWKVSQLTSTSTQERERERQRVTLPCLAPLPVWNPLIFAVKCMEIQNPATCGRQAPYLELESYYFFLIHRFLQASRRSVYKKNTEKVSLRVAEVCRKTPWFPRFSFWRAPMS